MKVQDDPAALEPVLAPVDADAREPCFERRSFPELVDVPPGAKKALLRRAVGFPEILEKPIGDPGDPGLVVANEVLESFRFPGSNLGDEARLIDVRIGFPWDHGQSWHIR